MLLNFSFVYVPFKAEVITILPLWAAVSQNSTIYIKASVNGGFPSYVFEELSFIDTNYVVVNPNITDFAELFDRASCSRFNTTIKLVLLVGYLLVMCRNRAVIIPRIRNVLDIEAPFLSNLVPSHPSEQLG